MTHLHLSKRAEMCTCSGGGQAPGQVHIKGAWMHCVHRPRPRR